MSDSQISVDEVIDFVSSLRIRKFKTLKEGCPFTVITTVNGIRFDLSTGSYMPVSRHMLQKYLKRYNAASASDRQKTTIYQSDSLREGSYMTRLLFEIQKRRRSTLQTKDHQDGLNDLPEVPEGSSTPDRAQSLRTEIKRDPDVRRYVIARARGKCEYCGRKGFSMRNGGSYLESHHIIELAKDGADTVLNVIALCADHHREAHFGKDAETLETKFIAIVKGKEPSASP